MSWNWLVRPATPYTWRFVRNVVLKTVVLFVLINAVFAATDPLPALGRLTIYNGFASGRARLPYGENPDQSYNLSLQNLDALFASHEIALPRAIDEYRVLLIGDSAVWGVLLNPSDTLAGHINAAQLRTADGRPVRAYNLGYPIQSLTKDLLILDYAMRYQPDLIVWLFTLESFAPDQQLAPLLVRDNPEAMRDLINRTGIPIDPDDARFAAPTFADKTIIGQRRALADLLRLQLYGVAWGLTAHDQTYPRFFEPRMEDFGDDMEWHQWHEFRPGTLTRNHLAFPVLRAGIQLAEAAGVPVVLVHEPMFISTGQNSALRYNYFYPRWALDRFREWMQEVAAESGYTYLDLWDVIHATEFTDSAVHLTPAGSARLASEIALAIVH